MAVSKFIALSGAVLCIFGCASIPPQQAGDDPRQSSTADSPRPDTLPADVLTWLEQVCAMAPGPERDRALEQGRAIGWEASCP